jgi:hypothetical protein
MSRTDKIIKSLMFFLGGLATIGFLITKNSAALNRATSGDYRYGDLYRFSKIEQFRPEAALPRGKSENQDSIDQGRKQPDRSDVIFLGDSFGFCDWGETPFHMQLQQKLGTSMFSVYNGHHEMYCRDPYLLLESETNHAGFRRVLVYEIAERSIQWQFEHPISTNEVQPDGAKAFLAGSWENIRQCVFDNSEAKTETLLKHSPLTSPAIVFWNTAEFELFRRIPIETPLYSLKPPFLFYKDEVASFEAVHDEQLIGKLADNIASLDRNLREQFGCTLVFVPVPNKITIYSRYVIGQPYDDFLPRLCAALKMCGVRTIELLPLFQKQTGLIYWPTDTHWNNQGIRLAVEQTLENWP